MNKTNMLKLACYSASATMSVVANLSPILFITFHNLYDISFSLLGLLVLINFVTQLTVDLIFSFFAEKFNIPVTVKSIPVIATIGFLVYALVPMLLPSLAYFGIVLGTVIFSAASGLNEVLISPVIAAIPSDDPDREMSKLHSIYAWGVVAVVIISTLYLLTFSEESWYYLALLFTLVPIFSAILFMGVEIPDIDMPKGKGNALTILKNPGVWFSVFAIFLAGAAECTMGQWSSGYLEQVLGIPKVWGDVLGVALFSVALGLGRSLYAKFGKRIEAVLLGGAVLATICYLTVAISDIPWISLVACVLTGFATSMLWPGNLVVASGKFPEGGVIIYALMAAGGDLGASVGPQLVGIITDTVIMNPDLSAFANSIGILPEQLGMKLGMMSAVLFPLIAIFVYLRFMREKKVNCGESCQKEQ